MKVYIDTGIFIDYLVPRGHVASYLRKEKRRGRLPTDLGNAAESCFTKIAGNHQGMTSSLTFYEVEEALYNELARSTSGIAHGKKYLIASARPAMTQVLMTVSWFRLTVLEISQRTIEEQISNIGLQVHGVRAADSLHVITAILHDAEIIISADKDILDLDGKFQNFSGATLRCLDSDDALALL